MKDYLKITTDFVSAAKTIKPENVPGCAKTLAKVLALLDRMKQRERQEDQ